MLNAEQATAADKAIPYYGKQTFNSKEERHEAVLAYKAERTKVTQEFRAYLEDTYSWGHSQKDKDLLWTAAWENGHSSGFHEVEGFYNEYTDLSTEELEELNY
jgi:hypothetical protein